MVPVQYHVYEFCFEELAVVLAADQEFLFLFWSQKAIENGDL